MMSRIADEQGMITYVLDADGNPVRETDLVKYHSWMEANYRVGLDVIGGVRVSTVFLGIDHAHFDGGPPVLWETMLFDTDEEYQERYTSQAAAIRGHERVCENLRMGLPAS